MITNHSSGADWKRRLAFGFWQIIGIGTATALAGAILYYAVALAHENSFNDSRAFRVLGEVAAQFRSLEASRSAILRNIPVEANLTIPDCAAPAEQTPQGASASSSQFALYVSRLDLVQARLCQAAATDTTALAAVLCKGTSANDVALYVNRNSLITLWCTEKTYYLLEEPFVQAARRFISQDFFTETVITLADGTVLGEFPGHDTAPAYSRVDLQPAVADTVNILNAHDLIRVRANILEGNGETSDPTQSTHHYRPSDEEVAQRPVAANDYVSQRNFRIYTLPFSGAATSLSDSSEGSAGPAGSLASHSQTFYVVGLRPIDVSGALLHTLWPGGLWILILFTALGVLAWPLLRLKLGHRTESITRRGAYFSLLAALLIPAFLVIGAASLWSYIELEAWASVSSERYARSLEQVLRQELVDGAEILQSYVDVYRNLPTCNRSQDTLPNWDASFYFRADAIHRPILSFDAAGHPIHAQLDLKYPNHEPCHTAQLFAAERHVPELNWSPFRTITAIDSNGKRNGPILTPFRPIEITVGLDLHTREYFQALKAGEAWTVSDHQHTVKVVAQRLFNRVDASKTLQISIPRVCDPKPEHANLPIFCGAISGSMRLHRFLDSDSPPLLRFAVIDTQSGTVVFHSNDQRSLAENFFLESELAPLLSAAIGANRSMPFSGQYNGDPHNFYYHRVAGTQWGIVVFFPEKELADLSCRAGICALVAYVGCVLGLLLLLIAAYWFHSNVIRPDRPPRPFLERVWPQTPLGPRYFWFARLLPSLWASLAISVVTLMGWTDGLGLSVIVLAWGSGVLLGWLIERWHYRRGRTWAQSLAPARAFTEVSVSMLILVSILPAYGLFVSFYQLQVQGLLHDELMRNTRQIERRLDLIQADFRHWAPVTEDWIGGEYPRAIDLIEHPDLGISDPTLKHEPPHDSRPVTISPWMFTRLVWESVADSAEQHRRLSLLLAPRQIPCTIDSLRVEHCKTTLPNDQTHDFDMRVPGGRSLLEEEPEWLWPRGLAVFFALLGVWLGTRAVCRIVVLNLFGMDAAYADIPEQSFRQTSSIPAREAQFHALWKQLTPAEQLLLYQLSQEHLVSPRNDQAVVRLHELGLIIIDPYPKLASPKVSEWIDNVDTKEHLEGLEQTANRSIWKSIGPPLFVLVMILIAWLSWAEGGIMKALSAILIATVAFLSQLIQLVTLTRTGLVPKAPSDGTTIVPPQTPDL